MSGIEMVSNMMHTYNGKVVRCNDTFTVRDEAEAADFVAMRVASRALPAARPATAVARTVVSREMGTAGDASEPETGPMMDGGADEQTGQTAEENRAAREAAAIDRISGASKQGQHQRRDMRARR